MKLDHYLAAVLGLHDTEPALHPLASDLPTIGRFVSRLTKRGLVRCCYEAGPCGLALQRFLAAQGVSCEVIAPTLIPRRSGDRIKTDRRDARQLAVLYRAGALTPIHIPSEQEEAIRDLVRCREDIRADLLRAQHRLSKFLLRHDRRYTQTKGAGSRRHTEWLRQLRWPLTALDLTFNAYMRAIDEISTRLTVIEDHLRTYFTSQPFAEPVRRLRCSEGGLDDLNSRRERRIADGPIDWPVPLRPRAMCGFRWRRRDGRPSSVDQVVCHPSASARRGSHDCAATGSTVRRVCRASAARETDSA